MFGFMKNFREKNFLNYAHQYACKISSLQVRDKLLSYVDAITYKMLEISNSYKAQGYSFKLADETELIECCLELCLKNISSDEYYNYIGSNSNPCVVRTLPQIKQLAEKITWELFKEY